MEVSVGWNKEAGPPDGAVLLLLLLVHAQKIKRNKVTQHQLSMILRDGLEPTRSSMRCSFNSQPSAK